MRHVTVTKKLIQPLLVFLFLASTATLAGAQEVEINKRPLKDLSAILKTSLDSKQIKLDDPFHIKLTGKLMANGKLDNATVKWTLVKGENKKMVEIAKQAIEAVNDSGLFAYIVQLKGTEIDIDLLQDGKRVSSTLSFLVKDERTAEATEISLNLILRISANADNTRTDPDTRVFLKATTVSSEASSVVLKTDLENSILSAIIMRRLSEEKPTTPQTNK